VVTLKQRPSISRRALRHARPEDSSVIFVAIWIDQQPTHRSKLQRRAQSPRKKPREFGRPRIEGTMRS
jgi:hypothetical protein